MTCHTEERIEEERERDKRYQLTSDEIDMHAYTSLHLFLSDLNKKQEIAKKNLEKVQAQLKSTDAELTSLKKVYCHTVAKYSNIYCC